jgi:hypothetical protein
MRRSAPAGSAGESAVGKELISELSVIAPFTASGAKRLRGVLELRTGTSRARKGRNGS